MSAYTWEIDKLPLSPDSSTGETENIAQMIVVLNQRELDNWDLMQIAKVDGQVVFFWRSKEKQ